MNASELLKILSDQNRQRILSLLQDGELCVCDLEEGLKLNQSNLSRHLIKLREAEIISSEKRGNFVYYSQNKMLNDNTKAFLKGILGHLQEDELFIGDKTRLNEFIGKKPESLCK